MSLEILTSFKSEFLPVDVPFLIIVNFLGLDLAGLELWLLLLLVYVFTSFDSLYLSDLADLIFGTLDRFSLWRIRLGFLDYRVGVLLTNSFILSKVKAFILGSIVGFLSTCTSAGEGVKTLKFYSLLAYFNLYWSSLSCFCQSELFWSSSFSWGSWIILKGLLAISLRCLPLIMWPWFCCSYLLASSSLRAWRWFTVILLLFNSRLAGASCWLIT